MQATSCGGVRAARDTVQNFFTWPPEPVPARHWTFLGPQWGRFPSGHFGPEIAFARALHASGYAPAIFKYSRESTSFVSDWQAPGAGGLYDDMTQHLNHALHALREAGFRVRVRAFVWIQGESDAESNDASDQYGQRLSAMLSHLRTHFLDDDSVIILGADERHPAMQRDPRVRFAQLAAAADAPCIARTSMEGLEKADHTHLTPPALSEHGFRLYETFAQASKLCRERDSRSGPAPSQPNASTGARL